ncbi:hypothetical protein GOP47_0010862, partial [Adiantum capillus-veneris]
ESLFFVVVKDFSIDKWNTERIHLWGVSVTIDQGIDDSFQKSKSTKNFYKFLSSQLRKIAFQRKGLFVLPAVAQYAELSTHFHQPIEKRHTLNSPCQALKK